MKLYEIETELALLWDAVEGVLNGEITTDPSGNDITVDQGFEQLERALQNMEMERDKKCLNVARLIKSLIAEEDAFKTEGDRIMRKRKSILNKVSFLKRFVSGSIPEGEKIKDATASIGWRKSSRVEFAGETEDLPIALITFIPEERRPDLRAIGVALKAGEKIENARIVAIQNLQIK